MENENKTAKKVEQEIQEAMSDKKSLTEQLTEKGLKELPVEDLSDQEKKNIASIAREFEELKSQVLDKKEQAVAKSSSIKDRVALLVKSGKVQIDDEEYKKSESSVGKYVDLLGNIIQEVEAEITYFNQFLADQLPKSVIVPLIINDSFSSYFTKKMKASRRYIKNIKKDLNVSYSRYCFGFDAQIRRITYIEKYLESISKKPSKS